MYPIETRLAPKSVWYTPREAKAYYGKYSRTGVTIHWWGDGTGANNHDNIVNYFLNRTGASVNYVLSDKKITKMVEPENVAWTSQSGNPTTISIEHQPTLSDEGYKRSGWLISELEKKFGPLKLYPHNHWYSTACPGTLDLNRIRAEADKFKGGVVKFTAAQIISIYTGFFDVEDIQTPQSFIDAYTSVDLTSQNLDGLLTQLKTDPTWLARKSEIQKLFSGVQTEYEKLPFEVFKKKT